MKSLPRDTGSWDGLITLFDPELGEIVSGLAGQLETFLGPARERAVSGGDEIDGYAGLTRRGSYERLLTTEWLLADEAPDEFLRRAASGEHAFHAIARHDPRARRALLALLDAGPEQIGAPRVAHIAALVALDRRARAQGAQLFWSVLQRTGALVRDRVDPTSFASFMSAHSDRHSTPVMIGDAVHEAGPHGPFAEIYLLGGPSTPHVHPKVDITKLCITEHVGDDRRALDIALLAGKKRPRELVIDLPSPPVCVKMLRDPFFTKRSLPARPPRERAIETLALATGFQIAPNGTRLLGVTTSGHAVALGVGGLGKADLPAPRVLEPKNSERILAIGYARKDLIVLGVAGENVYLHFRRRMSLFRASDVPGIEQMLADGLASIVAFDAPEGECFAVMGRERSLVVNVGNGTIKWITPSTSSLRATIALRHHPFFVEQGNDGIHVSLVSLENPVAHFTVSTNELGSEPIVVHATSGLRMGSGLVLAHRPGNPEYILVQLESHTLATPTITRGKAKSGEIVGLTRERSGPALITMPSPTQLMTESVQSAHRPRLALVAHAPIVSVTAAAAASIVAVHVADDAVLVYELDLGRTLLVAKGEP